MSPRYPLTRTALHSTRNPELLHVSPHYLYLIFGSLQVAVIAGNLELAEVIQSHKQEDIGKRDPHHHHHHISRLMAGLKLREHYFTNPITRRLHI